MKGTPATRLAIVLSHPTQYYSPWFKWIRANSNIEFKVFYLWNFGTTITRDPLFQKSFAWDIDLLDGYSNEFVPNTSKSPGTDSFWGLRNPKLIARLSEFSPSLILLFGYKYLAHLQLIAWSRLHSIPLLFRGDSHFLGRTNPKKLTHVLLKILYTQFDAITYVGQANRDYFKTLGIPEKRLWFAPHAVNNALYVPNSSNLETAQQLRATLGLEAKRVILFAGKFVPAKQPLELCEAFLTVASKHQHALVYVGDGCERDSVKAIANRNPEYCIKFLPFANQSEMPSRYLMADIFTLPSRGFYETWGLAVNEAMHMGRPCLVSDRVGCQRDLVEDNVTGWVFSATNRSSLEQKLHTALYAPLEAYAPRVKQRISKYTYSQATSGLLTAISSIQT